MSEPNPHYVDAEPEWIEFKDGQWKHWTGEEARLELDRRQKEAQKNQKEGEWVERPFHKRKLPYP